MKERIELLRDNDVNEAFARGIYEKYKLKQWADTTEVKIIKKLKERGLTDKQIKALTFDEVKDLIIEYESSGDQYAMNTNIGKA